MTKIEIKSKEYKICNASDNLVLYTMKLGQEIACTIFCQKLKKAALARDIHDKQLKQMMQEINSNNIIESGLLTVRLIGGEANSEESKAYLKHFIETLQIIDNQKDIINIISCDVNDRMHSDSFEFDCYHGGIKALCS